jgi:hypothetical protein
MTVEEAFHYVTGRLTYAPASFYGSPDKLSLGTGLLFNGVDYPSYSIDHDGYLTLEGKVWVITHECDIDQKNKRPFNDHVLVCPIIDFGHFVSVYLSKQNSAALKAFLNELAEHKLSRASYIPMIIDELPYGGILDFNKISNTHISVFDKGKCKVISAFSDSGQSYIDKILTNHFFRPKAESLPQGFFPTALSIFLRH